MACHLVMRDKNYRDWQIASHKSGSAQVTSSGKRTREAIPGKTKIHSGSSLRYPIRMQPILAWVRSLLARRRCAITFEKISPSSSHFLAVSNLLTEFNFAGNATDLKKSRHEYSFINLVILWRGEIYLQISVSLPAS